MNQIMINRENKKTEVSVSTISMIQKHLICLEILEGIKSFEYKKKLWTERIEGFSGIFPELRRKYEHNIDIMNRCIERLEQRYKRALNEF